MAKKFKGNKLTIDDLGLVEQVVYLQSGFGQDTLSRDTFKLAVNLDEITIVVPSGHAKDLFHPANKYKVTIEKI